MNFGTEATWTSRSLSPLRSTFSVNISQIRACICLIPTTSVMNNTKSCSAISDKFEINDALLKELIIHKNI